MMTTFSIERRKLSLSADVGKHGNYERHFCRKFRSDTALSGEITFVETSFPLSHPPKNNSEEERAATIHADRVAEFVGSSSVDCGINRDIAPQEQGRKRAGHQCSVN